MGSKKKFFRAFQMIPPKRNGKRGADKTLDVETEKVSYIFGEASCSQIINQVSYFDS